MIVIEAPAGAFLSVCRYRDKVRSIVIDLTPLDQVIFCEHHRNYLPDNEINGFQQNPATGNCRHHHLA